MTRRSSAARTILGWIILGLSSVLMGLLAQDIGMPAGWLVGPMLVAVALALAWPESPKVPRWGRVASMSGSLGADPRLVAVMQYTRVIIVVFSAALVARFGLVPGTAPHPILAQGLQATASQEMVLIHDPWLVYALTALVAMLGAWAGTRFRLPAGALMGPLVFGVALEVMGVMRLAWPPGVPQAAFLVLGLWVGLLFDRASVKSVGRLFPFVLASAAGLTGACAGLGWALTAITPIDGLTAYLATTPGGIDSVAVIALDSNADAPLVLAVQMLRLFAVILAGSLLGRWSSS